jgi:predicted alpha/beta-fold hydrolase
MSDSSDSDEIVSDDSKVLVEAPRVLKAENNESLVNFDSHQDSGGEGGGGESEETEEAYRLRVYGTDGGYRRQSVHPTERPLRTFSQRLSKELVRRRSSMVEQLPDTPAGWTVLLSVLLSMGLGYEIQLQKSLTKPPFTFGQLPMGSDIRSIYDTLTDSPERILSRPIQPSLFVGTRGLVSSTAAYLFGGPSSKEDYLRLQEIIQSTFDGASLGIDWEVPWKSTGSRTSNLTAQERKNEILNGPIREPVVIILHGINNDSSFGYIKSLQRSFANRGWNAAAMNFRGCGGVAMTTPRGYNGAYTNDLRSLVWAISGRMSKDVPVFLVGNSLGANVMTKYLGEEGMSGTLPKCVSGAASLGNPFSINSSLVSFPFNIALALGVKRTLLQNWSVLSKMTDQLSQQALRKAMLSTTIAQVDEASAPVFVRNDPFYPFAFRIGYKNGNSYWLDSSSYRLVRYISVPFLNLSAHDDFLVATPNRNRLGFCISNPNVMVAETRCGGHLGWQESPPDSHFGSTSWADAAASDFFDAIIKTNMERRGSPVTPHTQDGCSENVVASPETIAARKGMKEQADRFSAKHLKSRL